MVTDIMVMDIMVITVMVATMDITDMVMAMVMDMGAILDTTNHTVVGITNIEPTTTTVTIVLPFGIPVAVIQVTGTQALVSTVRDSAFTSTSRRTQRHSRLANGGSWRDLGRTFRRLRLCHPC